MTTKRWKDDECSVKPCHKNIILYDTTYFVVGVAPDDERPVMKCVLKSHMITIMAYNTPTIPNFHLLDCKHLAGEWLKNLWLALLFLWFMNWLLWFMIHNLQFMIYDEINLILLDATWIHGWTTLVFDGDHPWFDFKKINFKRSLMILKP